MNKIHNSDIPRTPSAIWIPLLLALALPTFFYYYGRMESYTRFFQGPGGDVALAPVYYQWIFGLVVFLLIPLLSWTGLLGYPLKDSGLMAGNVKFGLIVFFPALAMFILYAWGAAKLYEFQDIYPFYKYIGMEKLLIVSCYYVLALLYFISREFFLRGFLLQSLKKYVGGMGAVFIAAVVASPLFVNGSPLESTIALVLNVFLGWLALRSGSIWYGSLLSWAWMLAIDWFIILGI